MLLTSKGDVQQMEREKSNNRLSEIQRVVDVFEERFKAGTTDADNFITIHEIEQMWGELQHDTLNIYSDMVRELMSNIDERDLIRKKKENILKKV